MNQQLAYENEDLKKQVEHYQVSTIQQHTKETGWVTIKDNNYQEFIETLFASGYAVKIEPLKDRKMKITISEREEK
jgi:regulator of replication initiation timing